MKTSLKQKLSKLLQTLVIIALIVPFYSSTYFEAAQVQAANTDQFQSMILETDSRGGGTEQFLCENSKRENRLYQKSES